jgi:transcriptional regulator GlxA family with amidase domain
MTNRFPKNAGDLRDTPFRHQHAACFYQRGTERLPNGVLAGVSDPDVGKALALLHKQPSHPRTIALLAERFRHHLSDTPIGYLTRWRLQLAAQLLASTSKSVAEVAGDVGYESDPSFNRAFNREFGVPPARFRSQTRHAHPKTQ